MLISVQYRNFALEDGFESKKFVVFNKFFK